MNRIDRTCRLEFIVTASLSPMSPISRRRLQWLLCAVIAALPCLLYWGGISQRFGLRDDYSNLREAHEQPGWLIELCASQGRPIYGWLLDRSYAKLASVDSLVWVRAAATVIWGVSGAILFFVLVRRLRWREAPAAAVAALLLVLPGVQVETHWGVCWPHALAALAGLSAFALTESAVQAKRSWVRWALGVCGVLLLWAALLTYQPNALLYVIGIAAGFAGHGDRTWAQRVRWAVGHVFAVAMTLIVAFATIKILFACHLFWASERVVVELHWFDKLGWFLAGPLRQALALFVIADDTHRTEPWFGIAFGISLIVLTLGLLATWRRQGWRAAACWAGGLVALAVLAYAVSLVATERWPTYRTLMALSGVLIVFLVTSVQALAGAEQGWRQRSAGIGLMVLVVVGCTLARHNSRLYLAEAQAAELRRFEVAALTCDPQKTERVCLWLPEPQESPCAVSHLDEFGSLSGDCEWAAKEMLLQVMKARTPRRPLRSIGLQFSCRHGAPRPGSFDRLIDLHVPRG